MLKKIFIVIILVIALFLVTGLVSAFAYYSKMKNVESNCYNDGYHAETYLFNFSENSNTIEWSVILKDENDKEKIEVIPKRFIKNDLDNKLENEQKFEYLDKTFDEFKNEFIFSSDFSDMINYYGSEMGYMITGITFSFVVDLEEYKDITCDFNTSLYGGSDITNERVDIMFSNDTTDNDRWHCRANKSGFGNSLLGESYNLASKNKLTVNGQIDFDAEDSNMRFSIRRMNVTGDRKLWFFK